MFIDTLRSNLKLFLFNKNYLEIRRQILHLAFGLFLSYLILIDAFNVIFFSFLLLFSLIISFLFKKKLNKKLFFLNKFLLYFDRPEDVKNFPGKGFITFLVGSLMSVLVFEVYFKFKMIAFVAVLTLTIIDSFSSLYGNLFGKFKNPINKNKTLEGMFFSMIFLFLVLLFFLPTYIAFLIGFFSSILEALEIKVFGKVLDDNIYLPLFAGTILLIFNLFV